MPLVGLGVYQNAGQSVVDACMAAFEVGYRYVFVIDDIMDVFNSLYLCTQGISTPPKCIEMKPVCLSVIRPLDQIETDSSPFQRVVRVP